MRNWRRFLYLRVQLFEDDGTKMGEVMTRVLHVGRHMASLYNAHCGEMSFCLDDEEFYPDESPDMQWFGGGRRDCCWTSEILAPEALAFCRAMWEELPLWSGRWHRTWTAPGALFGEDP